VFPRLLLPLAGLTRESGVTHPNVVLYRRLGGIPLLREAWDFAGGRGGPVTIADVIGPLAEQRNTRRIRTVERRWSAKTVGRKKVKKVRKCCDQTAKGIKYYSARAVLFGSYPLNIHQ
jgi:hypothetical protein